MAIPGRALELIQRQLRQAWVNGRDVALTFPDGSVLRARISWVSEEGFAYVVPPLPPAWARFGDVVKARVVR